MILLQMLVPQISFFLLQTLFTFLYFCFLLRQMIFILFFTILTYLFSFFFYSLTNSNFCFCQFSPFMSSKIQHFNLRYEYLGKPLSHSVNWQSTVFSQSFPRSNVDSSWIEQKTLPRRDHNVAWKTYSMIKSRIK